MLDRRERQIMYAAAMKWLQFTCVLPHKHLVGKQMLVETEDHKVPSTKASL